MDGWNILSLVDVVDVTNNIHFDANICVPTSVRPYAFTYARASHEGPKV